MAPEIATRTVLPYQVHADEVAIPERPARTMADWGNPLPTRKLAPYEDVNFDAALQPRAHPMTGRISALARMIARDS